MAGAMLEAAAPEVEVMTAGTHVIEGQPMSGRTRDALAALDLSAPAHRSHQLTEHDVAAADLVVGMAAEHVAYVRRRHPEAGGRAATLRRLCTDLPPGPAPLRDRLAHLHLAGVDLDSSLDVEDPAGGDGEVFLACARQLSTLVETLVPLLA